MAGIAADKRVVPRREKRKKSQKLLLNKSMLHVS